MSPPGVVSKNPIACVGTSARTWPNSSRARYSLSSVIFAGPSRFTSAPQSNVSAMLPLAISITPLSSRSPGFAERLLSAKITPSPKLVSVATVLSECTSASFVSGVGASGSRKMKTFLALTRLDFRNTSTG